MVRDLCHVIKLLFLRLLLLHPLSDVLCFLIDLLIFSLKTYIQEHDEIWCGMLQDILNRKVLVEIFFLVFGKSDVQLSQKLFLFLRK